MYYLQLSWNYCQYIFVDNVDLETCEEFSYAI